MMGFLHLAKKAVRKNYLSMNQIIKWRSEGRQNWPFLNQNAKPINR